jgi:hypothetical protein
VAEQQILNALRPGQAVDDENVAVLGGVFPLSGWEPGRRASYFHLERCHVLDVIYIRAEYAGSETPTPLS